MFHYFLKITALIIFFSYGLSSITFAETRELSQKELEFYLLELKKTQPNATMDDLKLMLKNLPKPKNAVETMKKTLQKKNCDDYLYPEPNKWLSNDGQVALKNRISSIESNALNTNNYIEIDFYNWNGKGGSSEKCTLDNGYPILAAVRGGYQQLLNSTKKGNSWTTNLEKIKELRMKHPKSASISLLEVEYWIQYAWHARGRGYSSTVTKSGYKLFKQRIKKAEDLLVENKPYASDIPIWHAQMITVQSVLNRNPDQIHKVFLDGALEHKLYYPLYFTLLQFNLPKWGGDWALVDNIVTWSIKNTEKTEGQSMYARMYWDVYYQLSKEKQLFVDTPADWSKMKKGFEDLIRKYPKSNWNLNMFAKFACVANDAETFLSLRKKIDSNIYEEAWSRNATLDLCDSKMGYTH